MPVHVPVDPPGASAPSGAGGFALWNLGFRPFYLLAGLFAALSVPLWTARFAGWLGERVVFSESIWHAHEMIFGYAFAVVTGFLFTAVRNWTGRPTPTGPLLAAIAGLWLAARVFAFTPWTPLAAAADIAFALAAALGIGVPLVASGNRRNYFFIGVLLLLGAANLAFYLAEEELLQVDVGEGVQVALDLILFVMTVMGGRVIPMFTANAVPGSKPTRHALLERIALGSILLMIAADLFSIPGSIVAVIAALAALAHAARLALWQPWLTLGRPILWILHASYGWIVIHLALRALASLDLIPGSLATHALAVGAIGGMTLGMMTRTARGHTGRALRAGGMEIACYALVQLAAVVRVLVPLAVPSLYFSAIGLSGLLWFLAFALFTAAYWPILTQARADGAPG
jgi:uncharacterized protein involved in response to NO